MKNYLTRRNFDNGLDFNFFDDAFDDFFKPVFYAGKHDYMKTDVKETEKGYELSIDMPGYDKKDINLNLENGYITISAKRENKEEDKHNYIRRERSFSCSRSYYVGDNLTEEDIKAKYNNGILVLEIPKKEEKKLPSHRIEIE